MKRIIGTIVWALIAWRAFAQSNQQGNQPLTFAAGYTTSGAAFILTVSWPANSGALLKPVMAYVTCSAACNVTPEIATTAATTTVGVAVPLRSRTDVSSAVVYTQSNVVAPPSNKLQPVACAATQPCVIDLSYIKLDKNYNLVQNLTLRSDLAAGNTTGQILWQESQQ